MSSPSVELASGPAAKPWAALWTIIIGYFMILVDATIVTVAIPTISATLLTDTNTVLWVTSAYLLAYAVPLLLAGRLGDQFGPKAVYQIGLILFTAASLTCGLSSTIAALIAARAAQGLGAALMTPQTLTVITHLFPPRLRGSAMAVWGATAGAATLVGPILGGLLVGSWGWEWIFFVNVPVGLLALVLAQQLLPHLPTSSRRMDIAGVLLSGSGLLLLVFGVQEGQRYDWGTITGPLTVWMVIAAGLALLVGFVIWESRLSSRALMPLNLFRDRGFALANLVITVVGFAITIFALPIIIWAQEVRGFSTIQSALLLLPMAVMTVILSPLFGKNLNRWSPRLVAAGGVTCFVAGLIWMAWLVGHNASWPTLIAPSALIGIANASMWGALSLSATRGLDPSQAGAGSGVYNATRQIGSVLGSAAMATVISSRLAANLPTAAGHAAGAELGPLPPFLHAAFATAMGQSLLLPAAVLLLALPACLALPRSAVVSTPSL